MARAGLRMVYFGAHLMPIEVNPHPGHHRQIIENNRKTGPGGLIATRAGLR